MVKLLADDSETVKAAFVVPVAPSVTDTSLTEMLGDPSSSKIVRTAADCGPAAPVPATFERVRLTVSFVSSSVSLIMGTEKVCHVEPAGNISVPEVAV